MPKIPSYHAQVGATSVSLPRVPLDIQGTHPGAIVGAVLGDVAQNMDNARYSSQLAGAQTSWKEGVLAFRESLESDTDYATHEKRFDAHSISLQKTVSGQISHRGAQQAFDLYARNDLVVERARTRHNANLVELHFMEADFFKQLEQAVRREDSEFVINSTAEAVKSGYVNPLVGEKAMQSALHKIEYTTAWNDIIHVHDRNEALTSVTEAKGISPNEKNALMSAWEREETARDAKTVEEKEIKEEEARAAILPQIREGTITAAEIEVSALDTEEKYKWQERLYKRNKRVAEGKDNPFNVLDPAVDRTMMDRVYSSNPPTEKEIRGVVGEGLTVARAEHWIKQINQPDKGYKRALEYLQSQIMPRQALTVGESSPNSASYWKSVLALDEFLEKEPLTGNAILEKAMEMAPDYVLTIAEQVEAAKERWNIEEPPEKKGWWEFGKEWLFGNDETPEAVKQMTDKEIVEFLDEEGYVSNPDAVVTFRKNNGI